MQEIPKLSQENKNREGLEDVSNIPKKRRAVFGDITNVSLAIGDYECTLGFVCDERDGWGQGSTSPRQLELKWPDNLSAYFVLPVLAPQLSSSFTNWFNPQAVQKGRKENDAKKVTNKTQKKKSYLVAVSSLKQTGSKGTAEPSNSQPTDVSYELIQLSQGSTVTSSQGSDSSQGSKSSNSR